MQRLLHRELTSEERAGEARLRSAFGSRRATHTVVRDMAEQDPELFFMAALSLLESLPDPQVYPNLHKTLLDRPELLVPLFRPDRFSREQVLEACREFIKVDRHLDIRIARLVPGRSEDAYHLDSPSIGRVLDILNEISAGTKLILIMNHLTAHPDPFVASKAVLLMGRRIQNRDWVERHSKSQDPRLRANVVESLWGRNTIWARRATWAALGDENNRVVGNAVVGLHLLGESRAEELVRRMLRDERAPFRFTAAWVMGKMGDLAFLEPLREALADPDQRVRKAARRSLVTIRRPIVRQQQEMTALMQSLQPAVAPPEQPQAAPAQPEVKTQPEHADIGIRVDGSCQARR